MYRQCAAIFLVLLGTSGTATADLYNYGAIVFNGGSGAFGYSYNWRSRQQAVADAMRHCTGRCELIAEFWNNCASLSANKRGVYGWAANTDERAAMRQALANCGERGSGCQVKVTVCNDEPRSSPATPGTTDRYVGRHGCWYADWTRIPGCKD